MNVNVLIAFYSRYGNVRALAEAIAEGAHEVKGADVRLRRVDDLAPESVISKDSRWAEMRKIMMDAYPEPTHDDLEWADAIFLGTPTRYGNVSAELKLFIDKTGPLWAAGKLVDKVGSVFTSTSSPHGGQESTILSAFNPLLHLGMIIVAPGYADPGTFVAGSPYGATSMSGPEADQAPTEADLRVARFQGKRATERALWLKLGKQERGIL